MGSAWTSIDGVGNFYLADDALDHIPPGDLAIKSLDSPGRLRTSLGAANDSVTVTITNEPVTLALFATPPVGRRLTLYRGGDAVFTGTITQARVDQRAINLTTEG